jgi:hypothetical protein
MGMKKQRIDVNFIYKEGKEYEHKKNITKTISQYYAEAIINEIKNSVPENEVVEALNIAKDILLKHK